MKIWTFSVIVVLALIVTSQAYSPKIALEMAYLSSISYQSPATINAWSCQKCKQFPVLHAKAFTESVGDLQGFTGYSTTHKGIVLAFRGSSNIQNWIINLSTNQVDYPRCDGCKVHNGFHTAWRLAKTTVTNHIQSLRSLYRDAHIYITGHSLGGAVATLSAPDIKETFGNLTSLITFGQPRVGNEAFAKFYHSVITSNRVVHYADIVPHIPPSAMSFYHQGEEIWYDKQMKTYKACVGESPNCSNSLGALGYNTGDHSMDIYLTLPASIPSKILKKLKSAIQMAKLRLKVKTQQLSIQGE